MPEKTDKPSLAVLGGTGKQGKGLAYRWAKAGYTVYIGSRTPEKARQAAAEVRQRLGDPAAPVMGLGNAEAAARAEIVVLTVPYSAHRSTLEAVREALAGKILVDVTVPLKPPKVTRAQMPPAGSAAQEAQALLGESVAVVDAFQNIAHELLWEDGPIDCDVLVTGKGKANRQRVVQLVRDAGLRAWDAGPIENSAVVEGLTSVLIYLNKTYGSTHAGIRITGLSGSA
ncbi:MAG TPA: NADPH-dependent F420 reductase [Anaerolineae bacterium]|nr:NADPH-dependent F420 reductase [Anaerolineae bacterium]HID84852.1 NADPH-dependent F420 reductase [Anaerolineales bacterium]HIQ08227.1 NADPH-dependent F420 reductase [Anaerolineaceae bacterium]